MSPQSFVFGIWCANDKVAHDTVKALETIAANAHTVSSEGGRVMVTASTGGKSFSYTLPPDMTPSVLADMALQAWKAIKDLTPAQLELWLTRKAQRTTICAFNYPLT